MVALVAVDPQWQRLLEAFAARLLAALPYPHDHRLLGLAAGRLAAPLACACPEAGAPVERLDRVLAAPPQGVADLVYHPALALSSACGVARSAALQILSFALVAHDPR